MMMTVLLCWSQLCSRIIMLVAMVYVEESVTNIRYQYLSTSSVTNIDDEEF